MIVFCLRSLCCDIVTRKHSYINWYFFVMSFKISCFRSCTTMDQKQMTIVSLCRNCVSNMYVVMINTCLEGKAEAEQSPMASGETKDLVHDCVGKNDLVILWETYAYRTLLIGWTSGWWIDWLHDCVFVSVCAWWQKSRQTCTCRWTNRSSGTQADKTTV